MGVERKPGRRSGMGIKTTDGSGEFVHDYELGLDAISGEYVIDVLDGDGQVLATTVFYDTHFRFGHIVWTKMSGNTVRFKFTVGFRRSFRFPCRDANLGDVCSFGASGGLQFGDGTSVIPDFTIIGVDAANDWLLARAFIEHTYPHSGPFTAFNATCCRISPPRHINNPDGSWRVEAIVNLSEGNKGNPESLLPPIVDCPQDAVCQFAVPALDPDGQPVRWRLSQPVEWAVSDQPGPPHAPNSASIDPNTGIYTWGTTGATLNSAGETLYSTQVTMEDLDSTGTALSKSAIDFSIRLVRVVGAEKTIQIPIRWCVVRGTPSLGSGRIEDILLNRLDDVNKDVYTPQAGMQFRSGSTGTILSKFPVIDDPRAVGDPGDVVADNKGITERSDDDYGEYKEVVNRCRAKWLEKAPQVTGIVAVLVNKLVDVSGTTVTAAGVAYTTTFGNTASQVLMGSVAVVEPSDFFERVKAVAHEFGHALSLGHAEDDPAVTDIPHNFDSLAKSLCRSN